MNRDSVQQWIVRYEQCWRAAGTDALATVFTAGVSYRPSPWQPAIEGLAALADFWQAERDGPDERFRLTSEVLAVDGDLGVVRVAVDYDVGSRWRDLWLIRLNADGLCPAFEEWPFAPEQSDGHDRPG